MLPNILDELLSAIDTPLPNQLTIGMGQQIRKARKDAKMSQETLANKANRRRASISDIENGKMELNASTLLLLAYHLEKPLSYFFPEPYLHALEMGELTNEEKELISQIRRLEHKEVPKLIAQVKALADLEENE